MIRLEMKTAAWHYWEKLQKYQLYHQEKLIIINISLVPSNQKQVIKQTKFTYSLFGKVFEKQTKITEHQGKKQIDALNTLKLIKENKSDDDEKLLRYTEIFESVLIKEWVKYNTWLIKLILTF